MTLPPRHWRSSLAAIAACFCTAATPLNNPELRFRVTIPDGFEPETESAIGTHDLYTFVRPANDPSVTRTVVKITRLGGKLPPGVIVKVQTEPREHARVKYRVDEDVPVGAASAG